MLLPEAWVGKVAGFVLDPPYGRNSHGSMEAEQLLEAAMTSATAVACFDAGFVLILPMHPMTPHPMASLPVGLRTSTCSTDRMDGPPGHG